MILIYRALTTTEVRELTAKVADFFTTHPRRRVCHTNVMDGKTFTRNGFRAEIKQLGRQGRKDTR